LVKCILERVNQNPQIDWEIQRCIVDEKGRLGRKTTAASTGGRGRKAAF